MNYERLTQWLAGPVSTLIGLGASALTHSTISKAQSLSIATFVVGAGVTYLAHQKWLANLTKWWTSPSQVAASAPSCAPGTGFHMEPGPQAPGDAPPIQALATEITQQQKLASQNAAALALKDVAVPPTVPPVQS